MDTNMEKAVHLTGHKKSMGSDSIDLNVLA
jgi:hypothetical protein